MAGIGGDATVLVEADGEKVRAVPAFCADVRQLISSGRPDKALKAADRALREARKRDNAWDVASARLMQAVALANIPKEEPKYVVPVAEQAVKALNSVDDTDGELEALRLIAELRIESLQTKEAEDAAKRYIARSKDLEDRYCEAIGQLLLAQAYSLDPEGLDKGVKAANTAFKLFGRVSDRIGQALCHQVQSDLHRLSNEDDEAIQAASRALALCQAAKEGASAPPLRCMTGVAGALHRKALGLLGSRDPIEALRTVEKAAHILMLAGDKRNEAEALVTLAEAKIRICESRGGGSEVNVGTLEIAEMAVERVMKTRPHDFRVLAPALLIYSTALSHTGRARSALVAATDAKLYFEKAGNPLLAVKAMLLMAEAEVKVGWPGQGIETAEKAYRLCEELNDYDGQEDALIVIDQACEVLQLPTRADRRKEAEEEAKKMQEQRQQWAAMQYYQQGQLPAAPPAAMANQAAHQSMQIQEAAQDAPKQSAAAFKRDADPLLMKAGMSVEVVREKVNQIAASIIGGDDDYEADTPLMEAGLTSNTAVLLRDELSKDLPGIKLPPTLIFDYPSVVAISDFVIEQSKSIAG
eukprot:TRINITY_DN7292_c0_g6_i1.p1 TRINITY_DN7292_c0_g6~~TRINITY_DN7292_c0_g6_i1.p1  ORF type:complete len:599 (+),score=165.83 TRINITY_DN7292_c0_g6_i1:48-1799(+)